MSSATVLRPVAPTRRVGSRIGLTGFVDAAIALAALGTSLAFSAGHAGALRPGPHSLDWTAVLLLAGSTLPLLDWRRSPRRAFVVTTSVSVVLGGLGYSIGILVGPALALYLWASTREQARPWSRRDTLLVVALLGAYLGAAAVGDRGFPGIELLHTGLAFAVAWFAGERTRLRHERMADLEARARRAEEELRRDRRLALAEERTRIARDLHDSVGHAINVIVVRAGAARIRHAQEPDRSRAALEAIEDIARQTAEEIDHIVGALRDPEVDGGDAPTPLGLVSIPTLVARHRAAGLDVDLITDGIHEAPDPAVDLAAYRILQEALTNAARHGTGTAEVRVAGRGTVLELTVTNPTRDRRVNASNGGHGLIGMSERAALLGGTLDVDHDDTFRVRARLPYRTRPS